MVLGGKFAQNQKNSKGKLTFAALGSKKGAQKVFECQNYFFGLVWCAKIEAFGGFGGAQAQSVSTPSDPRLGPLYTPVGNQ